MTYRVIHGDCKEELLSIQSFLKAVCNMLFSFKKIRLPKPYNFISTFCHICVLRYIKLYTSKLSFIEVRKFFRMSVPIVTVKLYNNFVALYKSINAKLTIYKMLFFICYCKPIKYVIAYSFYFIRGFSLLLNIQLNKHIIAHGVFVSTIDGAISDFRLFYSRWRPFKVFVTYLAFVFSFISCLPIIMASNIAKMAALLYKTPKRPIKILKATHALNNTAISSLRSFRYTIASKGAIFGIWLESFCNCYSAANTLNRSNFIKTVHAKIIGVIMKKVNKYALDNIALPLWKVNSDIEQYQKKDDIIEHQK